MDSDWDAYGWRDIQKDRLSVGHNRAEGGKDIQKEGHVDK